MIVDFVKFYESKISESEINFTTSLTLYNNLKSFSLKSYTDLRYFIYKYEITICEENMCHLPSQINKIITILDFK